MFSYNYEKKDKIIFRMLRACYLISIILTSFITLLFLLFKNELSGLYNLSYEAHRLYLIGLVPYFIGFIFISISRVACSFMYSINKKKIANFLTILEPLILTPLIYILCVQYSK